MCVQVAKLHPNYRQEYFAFPQNVKLRCLLVILFMLGETETKKKKLYGFTIILNNISKIIKTSV